MMIHVCDRCHNRQEVQTGDTVAAKGWRDGLCAGCADAFDGLKVALDDFARSAMKAFRERERQPELKKLW